MATTSNTYTGNGTNKLFSITFPYLETSDINVYLNGVLQTITTHFSFANATTVEFVAAPSAGVAVLLDRSTDDTALQATFFPGSSIKANDLNENFDQVLYITQETNNNVANAVAGQIPNGTITNVKLAADSVASSNIVDGTIVNADVNASAGIVASKLAFTQSGSGATARTIDSKLKDTVSVKDFGAVGDGVTELSTALQAAHDALGPDGGTILIPAASSYYLMNNGVTFTKSVRLVGDGWYNSEILVRTNTSVVISTYAKLDVENIIFTALDAATNTCTFLFHQPSSANHGHSTIRNNFFSGARYSYFSQSTNAVVIDNNVIGCGGGSGAGLYLINTTNSDIGDSFITNNTISGDASSIGILVPSTSGINICNNKFNSTLVNHILISVGANLVGNYLISNNSFEGHTDSAIKLAATTGTITKTLITGNQFSSASTNHITVGNNATNTTITGNTFNSTNSSTGNGISIESGAKNLTITGNAFHQILNAITTAASQSAGITLGNNRFASDVTSFFSGDDGLNTYASNKKLEVARYSQNSSDTVYVDAFKFQGSGVLEVRCYGTVQGVGNYTFYRKVAFHGSGSTITDIDAAVAQGASMNVQIAAASGFVVVSTKRATGVGSTLTGYVEVIASGQITNAINI